MTIAVLLPVRNGEDFLAESIASVLAQHGVSLRLYIGDDASTDRTAAIIRTFSDTRIRVFSHRKQLGQFAGYNFLLRQAEEDLVHFWSHDDRMYPDCLAETVRFHQKYPGAGMSYCGAERIDKTGALMRAWTKDTTPELLNPETYARFSVAFGCLSDSVSSITLNRAVTGRSMYFDEALVHSGDFDLASRVSGCYDIGCIRAPLIAVRAHEQQVSRQYAHIYTAIREDLPVMNRFLDRTGLPERLRKELARNLHYPLYFDRILFLFRHGQIALAKRTLRMLLGADTFGSLFAHWLRFRFGSEKSRSARKSALLNRLFRVA